MAKDEKEMESVGQQIAFKLSVVQERIREFIGFDDLLTRFKIIYSLFEDNLSMPKLEKHFENNFFRFGPLDERDPFSPLVVRNAGGKITNFGQYESWSKHYKYVDDHLSEDDLGMDVHDIVDALEEVMKINGLPIKILPIIMLIFFRKVTKDEYEMIYESILEGSELMRFPINTDEADSLVRKKVTTLQLRDYYMENELDNVFFSVFGTDNIGIDTRFVDVIFKKGDLKTTLKEMRQDYVETRGKEPMNCLESCLFRTLTFLGRYNPQWETVFVEIIPTTTNASTESIFNANGLSYIPAPPWFEELIVTTLAKHNGAMSVAALLRNIELFISEMYSEDREVFLFACDLLRCWSFQKHNDLISFYPSAAIEKNDEGQLMWRENILPPLMKTESKSALKRECASSFPDLISLENALECPIELEAIMYDDEKHGDLFMIGFAYNCCGGDVGESLGESFRVERNRSILAGAKSNKHNSEIKVVETYFKNRKKLWEHSYPKNQIIKYVLNELKNEYNPWKRLNDRDLNIHVIDEKRNEASFCVCRYRFPTREFVFNHYTKHHVIHKGKIGHVEMAIQNIYDLKTYKTANGVVTGSTPNKRKLVGYLDEREFLRMRGILDRDNKVDKQFLESTTDASILNGIVDALLIILVHNDSISPKYLAHINREVGYELDHVINFTKDAAESTVIDTLRDAEASIGNLCYNLWRSSNMKVMKTMASKETKLVLEELIISFMKTLVISSELEALTSNLQETASKAMLLKQGIINKLSPRYIEASKRLFPKYADQSFLPTQDVHILMDSVDVLGSMWNFGNMMKYDAVQVEKSVNQTFSAVFEEDNTNKKKKQQQHEQQQLKKKRTRDDDHDDKKKDDSLFQGKKMKKVINTGAVHPDSRVLVQQALHTGEEKKEEDMDVGESMSRELTMKNKFVQISKKDLEEFDIKKEALIAMFKRGFKESANYLLKMKNLHELLFDENGPIGIIPVIPLPSIAAWEDRERATEVTQLDICNKRQLQYSSGELSPVTAVFVAFIYRFVENKILSRKKSIQVEELIDLLKNEKAFCKSIVAALSCYFDINKSCKTALEYYLIDRIGNVVSDVCSQVDQVDGEVLNPASAVMMTALILFHKAAELMCSFSNELRYASLVFGPGVRSMEQIVVDHQEIIKKEDALKAYDFLDANSNTLLEDEPKRKLADIFEEEAKECAILAKNYQSSFKLLPTEKYDDLMQNVLVSDQVVVADERSVDIDSVLFRLKKTEGYGKEQKEEEEEEKEEERELAIIPMNEDNFRLFKEKMQKSSDKRPKVLINRPLQVANEQGAIDINTSNRTWRDCKCVFCKRSIGNVSSGVVMTCGLSRQLFSSKSCTEFENFMKESMTFDGHAYLKNAMITRMESLREIVNAESESDAETEEIVSIKHLLEEARNQEDGRLSYGNHAAHPACLYRSLVCFIVNENENVLRCPKCGAIIATDRWRILGKNVLRKRYKTLALMKSDEMLSLSSFKKIKWDGNCKYLIKISDKIQKCNPTQIMFTECHTSSNRVDGSKEFTPYEYINSVASVSTPLYMLLYKGKTCSEGEKKGKESETEFGFNRENWSRNRRGQTAAFMAFVADISAKLCDDQFIGLSGHLPSDKYADDKALVIKNSTELLGVENDSQTITCSFTAFDFADHSKLKQVRAIKGLDGEEIPLTLLFQNLMKPDNI